MGLPPGYDHQLRTDGGIRSAYAQGARRILAVMPTGAGKTWLGAHVVDGAIRKGRRVVWLAHRAELCEQASRSLAKLSVDHGLIMAGVRNPNPRAPIQVCSKQTLIARPHEMPDADIIVDDEAHHGVAASFRATLEKWPLAELVLGLTATPERGDRQPLGEQSGGIYQAMVAVTSVAELQRTRRPDGATILCPIDVKGPSKYQPELFREPIAGLLEFGRNARGQLRRTIYFAGSVEEAQKIAREASMRGIRAACVDGKLDDTTRKARLEAFARGELDLLTNVMVLTEGFDVPATEVCAIGRGCAAASTFLQMVGRAIRSSPETGKTRALLIDYRGISHVHGLVEDETRTYSLDGKAISLREKVALSQCSTCGAVFAPTPKCPMCGAAVAMPRAKQRVKAAEAVTITRDNITPIAEKRREFDKLAAIGRARGYKPGWACLQFERRYGHWPSAFLGRSAS